jgi:hypothetical protein
MHKLDSNLFLLNETSQIAVKELNAIDEKIVKEVDYTTNENSSIWTCPEFNRREYLHSFFQYPAMMVPVVQKKLIEIVKGANDNIQNMIDPFMGSATTLVACMENGLNCYGQDVNPLAKLIASVRTGPYYFSEIENCQHELFSRIQNDKSESLEADFPGLYKWFKPNVAIELSKINRAIKKVSNIHIRRFFWVILAETVRLTSNDRTSTFKLHIRPSEEIDKRNQSPIDVFKSHFRQSIEDYKLHIDLLIKSNQIVNGKYKGHVEVRLCNSLETIKTPDNRPFFDLLVSSPGYAD